MQGTLRRDVNEIGVIGMNYGSGNVFGFRNPLKIRRRATQHRWHGLTFAALKPPLSSFWQVHLQRTPGRTRSTRSPICQCDSTRDSPAT